ncbi:hypothetical protein HFP15_38865 [Amycolatopsis sp. K13G38]|uniref:Immunity protein 35 domain-containing protein n=1 Tax=Amycolatopsis acididurans TaxID=2724524 RepID=A0ABX1JGM5_9PSEU|nr:hypothetical protein [Amycolatopsis acididurans]NKQ58821.1 hypothetical protein [Amycolatopsis acididurans]
MGKKLLESADTEELLWEFARDGFSLYFCGGRSQPTIIVGAYEWDDYIDIVNIRGENRVTAARVPRRGEADIFSPETIVWFYQGNVDLTLKAMLRLVHPEHPDAPTTEHPPPSDLHVPRAEQRPMTIRRADATRIAARAAKLADQIPELAAKPEPRRTRWWTRLVSLVRRIGRRGRTARTEHVSDSVRPTAINVPSPLAVNSSRGDSDGHDAASDLSGRVRQL